MAERIVTGPGRHFVQRLRAVVAAEEPGGGGLGPPQPARVAGGAPSGGVGLDQAGGVDGLLVVRGGFTAAFPPTGIADEAQRPLGLGKIRPLEEAQRPQGRFAVPVVAHGLRREQQSQREPPAVVGDAVARPDPIPRDGQAVEQPVGGEPQGRAGVGIAGLRRGIGVEALQGVAGFQRTGPLGPEGDEGFAEKGRGLALHRRIDALGARMAQPPKQPAQLIADGDTLHRTIPSLESETESAVGVAQAGDRPKVAAGQVRRARVRPGGVDTQDRDQGAGGVLEAETLTQRHPAPGEFADAADIGERGEVVEVGRGPGRRLGGGGDRDQQDGRETAPSVHLARRNSSTFAWSLATCSSASANGVGATTRSRV